MIPHKPSFDDLLERYKISKINQAPPTYNLHKPSPLLNLSLVSKDGLLMYSMPSPNTYKQPPPIISHPMSSQRPKNMLINCQYDALTRNWAVKDLMVQYLMK